MLTTKRFILRIYNTNDAKALCDVLNTDSIYQTTYGIPRHCDIRYARNWIKNVVSNIQNNRCYEYAVIRKTDNRYMGNAGLINVDHDNKKCDISYFIHPAFQNQGIATEVSARLIRYAFEELDMNRVGGICMAHNLASARVMEKLLMNYEGLQRNCMIKDSKVVSLKMYSILKDEYSEYVSKT